MEVSGTHGTMSNQRFVQYLTGSAVIGGVLGAIHGKLSVARSQADPTEHVMLHTATGLFLGPWAPVALPYWMWNQPDVKCLANPRGPKQPPASPGATAFLERLTLDGYF